MHPNESAVSEVCLPALAPSKTPDVAQLHLLKV